MTISPIGENKIYAVFTKPLAYKGTYLHDLGGELDSVLENIGKNIEFVSSDSDDVDTSDEISGISVKSVSLATKTNDYTALIFDLDLKDDSGNERKLELSDIKKTLIRVKDDVGVLTDTIFGQVTTSYLQDRFGNGIPSHTCHALSDFAINAVNMIYAYAEDENDENWNEQGIYGTGVFPEASDYAVHDFSADGGNYSRLKAGRDIAFQFEFNGTQSENADGETEISEKLALVLDAKSKIKDEWKRAKYNLLTKGDWRIWIDANLDSLSSSFNDSALSKDLPAGSTTNIFEKVEKSEILYNMIWKNADFNLSANDEYQFFFKILESDGTQIEINHDGDKTTGKIPLYAFRMPKERLSSGDFSFIDLWSISLSDIKKQRGGVTILNNVINAGVGEKTAIEVEMKSQGNLNVYIMTLDGNIVKRLSKGTVTKGTHYFYWDGKNNAGKAVARGLYFVRVSGTGIDETRKVMVVK